MPSTVIERMTYDAAARTLDIAFRRHRGTYRYVGVPPEEYQAFRNAPSKGTYLNSIFKGKNYRYLRVA